MSIINDFYSCCFTGHRKLPSDTVAIINALDRHISEMYNFNGVRRFFSGGAAGFDLLAAEEVLNLKSFCPDIRLTMVLPFPGYNLDWPQRDKKRLSEICPAADEVIYSGDRYQSGIYYKRNRYIVNHSEFCVAYLDRFKGGTFYTVKYALNNSLSIFNIASEIYNLNE